MKTITLTNGYEIPAMGFGTFPQKESLLDSVPAAMACGCRLIDVSDNYGNERFAGEGMARGGGNAAITVVTKFSQPLRTGALEKCFTASERKLGGRIDIYLLHWPFPFLWKEQWRRMEDIYLAGRCKAIGVCNFDARKLRELLEFCRVKPAIDQFERHPLFQQNETASFCRRNGIVVMCYSPFARMDPLLMHDDTLEEIARAHKKTVGQVILRWSLEHGDVPIPASRFPDHIASNFSVFDFSLCDEEIRRIDALDAGHRVRFDPDKRFSLRDKARFLRARAKLSLKDLLRRCSGKWRRA